MKKRHLILLAIKPVLSLPSPLTSLLIVRACFVPLMMSYLIFASTLFPTANAASGTIYRIKIERGNTLFTDYPRAGAKALELPAAKVVNAANTPTASISSTKQAAATLIRIASPKPEELMIVPSGETICRLELAKPLAGGASIRVWLNGRIHASATAASLGASGMASLRLNGLNPGQHSLRADIFDARGKTLFTTKTRIFYVMRKLPNLR